MDWVQVGAFLGSAAYATVAVANLEEVFRHNSSPSHLTPYQQR